LLLAGVAGAQQPPPSTAPSAFTPWSPGSSTATVPPRLAVERAAPVPAEEKPPMGDPLLGGLRSPEMGLNLDQPAPYTIQLDAPSIERVGIAVQSDAQLQERIRQENRERRMPERIIFPADPVISSDTYQGRKWYPMKMEVAPYYVCHGRLYFEQPNLERYGWDLGVFTPLLSAGMFLYDFAFLPYHLAMEPCRRFEYNTGLCLPGDPVPLMLYPLELSATGFVAEVATVVTLVAVFP
jgi:hypothetical protein